MEQETSGANDEVTTIGHKEYLIMFVSATAEDSLDTQPHKQQIGQSIDDLGSVDGRIVILSH